MSAPDDRPVPAEVEFRLTGGAWRILDTAVGPYVNVDDLLDWLEDPASLHPMEPVTTDGARMIRRIAAGIRRTVAGE